MEATAVGSKTVYGGMAQQLQEDTRESPLHVRLDALASTISKLGIAAAVLVAASDLFLCLIVQGGMRQHAVFILQHVLARHHAGSDRARCRRAGRFADDDNRRVVLQYAAHDARPCFGSPPDRH